MSYELRTCLGLSKDGAPYLGFVLAARVQVVYTSLCVCAGGDLKRRGGGRPGTPKRLGGVSC